MFRCQSINIELRRTRSHVSDRTAPLVSRRRLTESDMNGSSSRPGSMRTLRFHDYGEPADVLRLEETTIPIPGPAGIRVRVHAGGLNPADWALCRGLFAGNLPRGIGLDVSGIVDSTGDSV